MDGGTTVGYSSQDVQEMDLEFQVNAQTFGFLDQTLLLSDGSTWSVAAGTSFGLGQRNRLGVEIFYSPLDVLRPGATSSENDGLLNLRFLLTRKLR